MPRKVSRRALLAGAPAAASLGRYPAPTIVLVLSFV